MLKYGLVHISSNKVPSNVEKDLTIENCNINNTVASEITLPTIND